MMTLSLNRDPPSPPPRHPAEQSYLYIAGTLSPPRFSFRLIQPFRRQRYCTIQDQIKHLYLTFIPYLSELYLLSSIWAAVADPETLAVAADRVPALVDSRALARSVEYV